MQSISWKQKCPFCAMVIIKVVKISADQFGNFYRGKHSGSEPALSDRGRRRTWVMECSRGTPKTWVRGNWNRGTPSGGEHTGRMAVVVLQKRTKFFPTMRGTYSSFSSATACPIRKLLSSLAIQLLKKFFWKLIFGRVSIWGHSDTFFSSFGGRFASIFPPLPISWRYFRRPSKASVVATCFTAFELSFFYLLLSSFLRFYCFWSLTTSSLSHKFYLSLPFLFCQTRQVRLMADFCSVQHTEDSVHPKFPLFFRTFMFMFMFILYYIPFTFFFIYWLFFYFFFTFQWSSIGLFLLVVLYTWRFFSWLF